MDNLAAGDLEVYGIRLKPLESRDYTFQYRLPNSARETSGLEFRAIIGYYIHTEEAHEILKRKHALTAYDPCEFTFFKQEIRISGLFVESFQDSTEQGTVRGVPVQSPGLWRRSEEGLMTLVSH
jgi:hypothetical protein